MLGASRSLLPSVLVCLAVLAAASPAAAQFVSPPPAAPILPPELNQQRKIQTQAPVQFGQRCMTSAGICGLSAAFPIGTRCSCSAGGRRILGQVVH